MVARVLSYHIISYIIYHISYIISYHSYLWANVYFSFYPIDNKYNGRVWEAGFIQILGNNGNKLPGSQITKRFTWPKYMWTGFIIQLNEDSITDSNLNHQILLFSAFFHYETLRSVQHQQNNFREIPLKSVDHTALSFWFSCSHVVRKVYLHLLRSLQQILRLFNIPNNQQTELIKQSLTRLEM